MSARPLQLIGCLFLTVSCLAGCAEESEPYLEVKRPSERITADEWAAFRRIVEALPAPKLLEMKTAFPPLPEWQEARSLPVNELVAEERRSLQEAWSPDRHTSMLARNKPLQRLLRREKLTLDQFCGLEIAIGAAINRSQLPDEQSFDAVLRSGQEEIDRLQRDRRLFSGLNLETRHQVLDRAVWLHRYDRAERLREVPLSNVALVREHKNWLLEVMPPRWFQPPWDDVIDHLSERGIPFVELPGSGSDDHLEWSLSDVLAPTMIDSTE